MNAQHRHLSEQKALQSKSDATAEKDFLKKIFFASFRACGARAVRA